MKYLRGLGIALASVVVFLVCGLLGLLITVLVSFSGFIVTGAIFIAFMSFCVWQLYTERPKKPPKRMVDR